MEQLSFWDIHVATDSFRCFPVGTLFSVVFKLMFCQVLIRSYIAWFPPKSQNPIKTCFLFVALGRGQERPAKKVLGRSNGNPKRGFKEVSRHKKQQLKLEVSMIWVNSRTKPPVGHLKWWFYYQGIPPKSL